MATIVNNHPAALDADPVRESSGAGWAVAVIVLLAVIVAGVYLYNQNYGGTRTTNVNLTVPSMGSTESNGNSSGSTGGTTGGTGSSGTSGSAGGTSGTSGSAAGSVSGSTGGSATTNP